MSKVISGDSFSASIQSWQKPELLGKVINPPKPEVESEVDTEIDATTETEETSAEEVVPLTEQDIEQIKKQAYDEGFTLGKQDGLVQGQADAKTQIDNELDQIRTLLNVFDAPLKQLDDVVEQALLELSVAIAKQVVRRELKMDPGQIIAVIREALGQLPSGALFTRIFLHPEDAVFVKEALLLDGQAQSIEVREDPTLSRGGCRLETDTSQIDASVEFRIAEIAASVLGGERHDDLDE